MYGVSLNGELNGMYGKNHTEETKQKMKDNHCDFSDGKHPMSNKAHSSESKENMRKGSTGKNRGLNSKITELQVKEIKIMLSDGISPKQIADILNIKIHIVKDIKYLKSWIYIFPELNDKITSFYDKSKATKISNFTKDDIKNILKDNAKGISGKILAEKWKCNINTIFRIINLEGVYGEIYRDKQI